MKNCYCPRCGGKQMYKIDDPCRILQPCTECGVSLLIKMCGGELIVRVRLCGQTKKNAPKSKTG